MARQYGAFLVRAWRLGGDQRFEVAHIQSGAHTRAATLEEVIAWVGACLEAGHAPDERGRERGASDDKAAPGTDGRARAC
jgi:hypothetical protein